MQPPNVRQQFVDTGLSHLSAVSGSNIAILASAVMIISTACGARRRTTSLVTAASLCGFVVVVGRTKCFESNGDGTHRSHRGSDSSVERRRGSNVHQHNCVVDSRSGSGSELRFRTFGCGDRRHCRLSATMVGRGAAVVGTEDTVTFSPCANAMGSTTGTHGHGGGGC